jgi:toxin YoeB
MTYQLVLSDDAGTDIAYFKKYDRVAYGKIEKLLLELMEHPCTGTGRPEPLKFNLSGKWSRRISRQHRLVYTIAGSVVTVYSLKGHYSKEN